MGLDASLKSDPQLSEARVPGVRALDNPSMASKPVVALDSSAGNAGFDATRSEMFMATLEVIAFVRMQLVRPASRPAFDPVHGRKRIDQLLKHHRVMPIRSGHAKHQRNPFLVGDEVALAAEFASVCRVGARVRAPRGLGTDAASRLARLRSNCPAPRSSASKTICMRCHTPFACHCRSRRQQVMPLPYPSSAGRCSHGVPVRSTNKMPLSAFSSSSLGLPPLGETGACGTNGLSFFHNAALISLSFFMPCQTPARRFSMTGFVSGS
jgi:hypothetical protein